MHGPFTTGRSLPRESVNTQSWKYLEAASVSRDPQARSMFKSVAFARPLARFVHTIVNDFSGVGSDADRRICQLSDAPVQSTATPFASLIEIGISMSEYCSSRNVYSSARYPISRHCSVISDTPTREPHRMRRRSRVSIPRECVPRNRHSTRQWRCSQQIGPSPTGLVRLDHHN